MFISGLDKVLGTELLSYGKDDDSMMTQRKALRILSNWEQYEKSPNIVIEAINKAWKKNQKNFDPYITRLLQDVLKSTGEIIRNKSESCLSEDEKVKGYAKAFPIHHAIHWLGQNNKTEEVKRVLQFVDPIARMIAESYLSEENIMDGYFSALSSEYSIKEGLYSWNKKRYKKWKELTKEFARVRLEFLSNESFAASQFLASFKVIVELKQLKSQEFLFLKSNLNHEDSDVRRDLIKNLDETGAMTVALLSEKELNIVIRDLINNLRRYAIVDVHGKEWDNLSPKDKAAEKELHESIYEYYHRHDEFPFGNVAYGIENNVANILRQIGLPAYEFLKKAVYGKDRRVHNLIFESTGGRVYTEFKFIGDSKEVLEEVVADLEMEYMIKQHNNEYLRNHGYDPALEEFPFKPLEKQKPVENDIVYDPDEGVF